MREIRFRAWDRKEGRMLYAGLFDGNWYATPSNDAGGCHTVRGKHTDDRLTLEVMQYVGIEDRNGREVYEGDIVKLTGKHPAYWKFEVRSDTSYFYLNGIHEPLNIRTLFDVTSVEGVEIIGNVYEHKHLLSGQA